MPRLSVILPAYNAERYLDKAVDSVRDQTFEDWELILVDDGSRDATPVICDRRAAADGRVRVIHQENGGLSAARNAGMSAAQGEYLAFLDADDYLTPGAYEALFAALDASNADCAGCGYTVAYDDALGETVLLPLSAGAHDAAEVRDAIVLPLLGDRLREGAFTGMVWRFLFKRSVIEEYGLKFTDAYLEDELFLIRYFSSYPCRLAVVDEGLYFYYQSAVSITRGYFAGFAENYLRVLEVKSALAAQYGLAVPADWKDNCAWAGLLAAVGNEYAPGSPGAMRDKTRRVRALCAEDAFAHALKHYKPAGMNRRKTVVAALLRCRAFGALSLLYAVKNRGRN